MNGILAYLRLQRNAKILDIWASPNYGEPGQLTATN